MTSKHYDLAMAADDSYSKNTHGVSGDVECFVLQRTDCLIVAFRGTEVGGGISWHDVVRDLRAAPWYDRSTGWAHAGIMKGARRWVDEHYKGIKELAGDRSIIVTGHSLGGGLAVCAALFMIDTVLEVDEVVTFGAPRVVHQFGVDRLKNSGTKVTQYRYRNDFVTTIPWRIWGYRHCADLTALNPAKGRRTWDDHDIDLYIDWLKPVPDV